jgi:hypothetical protein
VTRSLLPPPLLHGIAICLLALWLACGAALVVSATAAFPELAARGVVVPGFERLAEADPAASGRLAAGLVLDRIFAVTDRLQWLLGGGACLCAWLLWRGAAPRRRGGALALLLLVSIAFALTAIHNLLVAPPMEHALAEYRSLVMAATRDGGSLEAAYEVRDGFDRTHRIADRLYALRMGSVGLALLVAAFTPLGRGGGRR